MKDSSLRLDEVLPIEGRALLLRKKFNLSLINSLKYLMEICEEVIPAESYQSATQKVNSLDLNYKISGLLGGIHLDFYSAVKQKDTKRVNSIIQRFISDKFQEINEKLEAIQYINLSDLNEYYNPIVKKVFVADLPEEILFHHLSPEAFEKAKHTIQEGFQIEKETFPDFYNEAQDLISEVLILNGQNIRAGSSADLFGMIYRNHSYNLERLTDVLDFIIHEQSHLYVHLLANDDPLVLNPDERYESPLRKEKRPLIGIYHAAFVLTRIIYILEKSLEKGVIPAQERDYTKELIEHYKTRFKVGLKVIETHAQMSNLGTNLMLSASRLVA